MQTKYALLSNKNNTKFGVQRYAIWSWCAVEQQIEIVNPTDVRWKKKVGEVFDEGGTISIMDIIG